MRPLYVNLEPSPRVFISVSKLRFNNGLKTWYKNRHEREPGLSGDRRRA